MNFTLRPWREEDAASLAQAANDPAVAANLRDAFPCPYSLADAQWFINDCIVHNRQDRLVYAVTVGGRPVGCVSVQLQSDVYRKSAELGYWLAQPYWGQGVMTRAVSQICQEAFGLFDIIRIYAEPFAHNQSSRRETKQNNPTIDNHVSSCHQTASAHRAADSVDNSLRTDHTLRLRWKV